MNHQILESIFEQLNLLNYPLLGIIQEQMIIACNDKSLIQQKLDLDLSHMNKNQGITMMSGYLIKHLLTDHKENYMIFVKSTDAHALEMIQLLSQILNPIFLHLDDQIDEKTFYQYILYGKNLPRPLIEYLPRYKLLETDILQVLMIEIIDDKQHVKDYINQKLSSFSFTEHITNHQYVAIVNHNKKNQVQLFDELLHDHETTYKDVFILSLGQLSNYQQLNVSFNGALDALKMSKTFHLKKTLLDINRLGIYRLVYEMPLSQLEKFMTKDQLKHISDMDDETLDTINEFLMNDLNITDTAKHLFIHRNTLLYRLNKTKEIIKLDVRKFDDAMWFLILILTSYKSNLN